MKTSETRKLLIWLRTRGACPRSLRWIGDNQDCTLEQLYNAIERYDWLVSLLLKLGYEAHVTHLNFLYDQHQRSAYWRQLEYRRFVNRQMCDNIRYRLPIATVRERLATLGVLR